MMRNKIQKKYLSFLPHVVVTVFGLSSAYIVFFNYPRVPYWDSFQYVFVSGSELPSITYLLAQHNEHRILFTKLLFFLEHNLFGGSGYFLISTNFVFATFLYVLLISFWRRYRASAPYSLESILVTIFSGLAVFSLIQIENLSWEFQSQFFLAYLLPLFSLLYLVRKGGEGFLLPHHFLISWLAAAASVLTMGNGILAMPILALVLLLQRRYLLSAISLISSLGLVLMYLVGYQTPAGQHSSIDSLLSNPVGVFAHFVSFLGNPIAKLIPNSRATGNVVFWFGMLVLLVNLAAFAFMLTSRDLNFKHAPLVGFNTYLLGSAFLVALGRNKFGTIQALSGRYSTPALLLLVSTTILLLSLSRSVAIQKSLGFSTLILILVLVVSQFAIADRLLNSDDQKPFASIAAAKGIDDTEVLQTIFPSGQFVLDEVSKMKTGQQNNIFTSWGMVESRTVQEDLGKCEGFIDTASPVGTDGTYSVSGWLRISYNSFQRYNLWRISASSYDLFVALGYSRPDVASALDQSWKYFGFRGYVVDGQPVLGPISGCTADKNY